VYWIISGLVTLPAIEKKREGRPEGVEVRLEDVIVIVHTCSDIELIRGYPEPMAAMQKTFWR